MRLTNKLACERFLGATGSLQQPPGRVCLHRAAWKKAGKLQVDEPAERTTERGKDGGRHSTSGRGDGRPGRGAVDGPSGHTKSRLRCLGSALRLLLPQLRWPGFRERQGGSVKGGEAPEPWRPRSTGRRPPRAGPGRRRRNAGPAAGFRAPRLLPSFPRRSAEPSGERPPAPGTLGPGTAPRPRGHNPLAARPPARDLLPPLPSAP